ncbi:hypothetical protein DMENIID0001_055330 [Sergentomyia squamirostris]
MKVCCVVFLACLTVCGSQLTNPLTDAYLAVGQIFYIQQILMQNTLDYMNFLTRTIADSMLEKVTNEIYNWTQGVSEDIGENLRACTLLPTSSVFDLNQAIYEEWEMAEEEGQHLQFIVMRQLKNFDLINDYEAFYDQAVGRAWEIFDKSEKINQYILNYLVSRLQEMMGEFPKDLEQCISESKKQRARILQH